MAAGNKNAIPGVGTPVDKPLDVETGLFEVTLVKEHEHGGKKLAVGDKLKVRLTTKSFLEKAGVIEKTT